MASQPGTGFSRRDLAALLGTVAGASLLDACTQQVASASEHVARIDQAVSTLDIAGVATYADLREINHNASPYGFVLVSRYDNAAMDDYGAAGIFYWDASETSRDNDGTIIKPGYLLDSDPGRWRRIFSGPLNVRWFGVRPGGISPNNNAEKIHNAIDALPSTGGSVFTSLNQRSSTQPGQNPRRTSHKRNSLVIGLRSELAELGA